MKNSVVAVLALAAAGSLAQGDIIASWSITTAFPTGTGNVPTGTTYGVGAADAGALTAGSSLTSVHAAAAATYTSPAGNGSQYAFSSNNWNTGDYYQASFSTTGYSTISLSWDQARSSTGPSSFTLIMSTDGGANWTTVLASYTVLQSGGGGAPATWSSTGARNAIYTNTATLSGAENKGSVLVRFQSISGLSAATGSNRIDNVEISGTAVPAPGALALVGLGGLVAGRRRR